VEVRGKTGRAEYGARVSSVDSLVFVVAFLSYIGGSCVLEDLGVLVITKMGRLARPKWVII
jgi:hypothetical protein